MDGQIKESNSSFPGPLFPTQQPNTFKHIFLNKKKVVFGNLTTSVRSKRKIENFYGAVIKTEIPAVKRRKTCSMSAMSDDGRGSCKSELHAHVLLPRQPYSDTVTQGSSIFL
jgi:hypothetical protein